MQLHKCLILIYSLVLIGGCGKTNKAPLSPQAPLLLPSTTPSILVENLKESMVRHDATAYSLLLAQKFWFDEKNCVGEIVFENDYSKEIEIVNGMEGVTSGLFQTFRTIDFQYEIENQSTEQGSTQDRSLVEQPDFHPEENWEVLRVHVSIQLSTVNRDSIFIDQNMLLKTRLNEKQEWEIVRWIGLPLEDDCGTGKVTIDINRMSWGRLKDLFI